MIPIYYLSPNNVDIGQQLTSRIYAAEEFVAIHGAGCDHKHNVAAVQDVAREIGHKPWLRTANRILQARNDICEALRCVRVPRCH